VSLERNMDNDIYGQNMNNMNKIRNIIIIIIIITMFIFRPYPTGTEQYNCYCH